MQKLPIVRQIAKSVLKTEKKSAGPDLGLAILPQISNYTKNSKRWRLEDKCFSTGLRQK